MPSRLVLGGTALPSLQIAALLLYPCMPSSLCVHTDEEEEREREREREGEKMTCDVSSFLISPFD